MFLSDLSIARPVFAIMITTALVIFGLISFKGLGVEENPDVEFPFVMITTVYPGADPETVESEVTEKIEDAVATLSGIKSLSSSSAENVSLIFIEYELEVNVDLAAQDVRDRMARIQSSLPDNVETPVVEKFDINAQPVMAIVIGGDIPPGSLAEYVEDTVKPRIESVEGVGTVSVSGLRDREIRIWLNSDHMAAFDVSPQQIIGAIRANHIDIPGGRVETGEREYLVVTSGELKTVDEFNDIIVAKKKNGTIVRLNDVATVEDGLEDQRSIARLNGEPASGLRVIKKSGANTIAVADGVYKVVDELKAEAPPGIKITVPQDDSIYTRESYEEISTHVGEGALIAIIIILMFLGNFRTTIIAAATIPTSITTTFIFMRMFGFTLNNVTMLAFSLMVGMLVDDAIVVLENIFRHTEMGKTPIQAAKDGAKEIAFAVLATTLSIVAVFVPVAYMSGIVGRFMYQYGITVAAGTLTSYFVAFLLAPMLSSRFLTKGKDNFFLFNWFDSIFKRIEIGYRATIAAALRRKWLTLFIATIAMISALFMFGMTKKEFFSLTDMSRINISMELPLGTSISQLDEFSQQIEQISSEIPEVLNVFATLGTGSFGEQNEGNIYLQLSQKKERKRSQQEIEEEIRQKIAHLVGAKVIVGATEGFGSSYDFMMTLKGTDMDELQAQANRLTDLMRKNPMFREVDTSSKEGKPEVRIHFNRDRAADLGIDVASVGSTIRLLVSGEDTIATFKERGRQADIKVRLEEQFRNRPEYLSSLLVYNYDNDPIPVSSFATVDYSSGTSQISHLDKMKSIDVLGNLNDGYVIGEAVDFARKELFPTIPQNIKYKIGGEAEMMEESFTSMGTTLILAIILIYMILAAQFNHFIHPVTIMSSLPLSFIGAFGLLFLTGMTVNIFSLIGVIMLMGLVTKNAILVVEFTNQLRERGMSRDEALLTAGPVRLRPVLMTALSTIGGMLPVALMIGGGAGVEMRAPMAVAVIGGMVTSTFLTLVVVPVVYSLFDGYSEWFIKKLSRRAPAE